MSAQEAMYLKVLNSLKDGILALDRERTIVFANQPVYDTLGREAPDIMGQKLDEVVKDDRLRMLLDQLELDSYISRETEVAYPRHLNLKVKIVPLEDGGQACCLLVLRDVTQDVAQARDNRHMESLVRLGLISSQLAHELRNRLNPLLGQAQLLKRDLNKLPESPFKETASRRLEVILEEGWKINDLVKTYLGAARQRAIRPVETDLRALCTQVLDSMEPQFEKARVTVERILQNMPPALLDPGLWEEALRNVLNNAMEAMTDDGPRIITVSLSPDGGDIVLTVRDTGCGMDQETLRRAFEPFYTTKAQGHGLGMLQIRQAMKAHNGEVELKSGPRGTKVTLRAPLRFADRHAISVNSEESR